MQYVIAGAGEIGSYLASWLSSSDHNVIVIEKDLSKLQRLGSELDVSTLHGSATDLKLLTHVAQMRPDVFLAVTDNDETNMVACAMAKSLGAGQTVARVKNPQYLSQDVVDFQSLFMADHILCPEWVAARALLALVQSEGDYACESFADGAIQMRRIRLGASWKKEIIPLKQLDIPTSFKVAVIKRYIGAEPEVLFPHGDDHLLVDDELTLIGQAHAMHEVDAYFDQQIVRKRSIFIVGQSHIAGYLAMLLERLKETYHVTLIDPDYSNSISWARSLKKTRVLHQQHLSPDFLRSNNISACDLFIACSLDEHFNLTACSMAKELGAPSTATILNHPSMVELAASLHIEATVCPNDYIASQIVKLAGGTKISSVASVYSHRAEVVELRISPQSRLTGIPLHRLANQLPDEFLIGVVQHRGQTILAHGGTVLCPGDIVIAVCSPQHLEWIQKMV